MDKWSWNFSNAIFYGKYKLQFLCYFFILNIIMNKGIKKVFLMEINN